MLNYLVYNVLQISSNIKKHMKEILSGIPPDAKNAKGGKKKKQKTYHPDDDWCP